MPWKTTRGCATPSLNTPQASTTRYAGGRLVRACRFWGRGLPPWRISADCDEFANIYEAARTMEQHRTTRVRRRATMIRTCSWARRRARSRSRQRSRGRSSTSGASSPRHYLGTNPSRMNAWDLETYGDTEVIAIDQDPLGKQGTPRLLELPSPYPEGQLVVLALVHAAGRLRGLDGAMGVGGRADVRPALTRRRPAARRGVRAGHWSGARAYWPRCCTRTGRASPRASRSGRSRLPAATLLCSLELGVDDAAAEATRPASIPPV